MSNGKNKTILLTLGRLPKALELARALRTSGCRVLVADPFTLHLCRASNAVDRSFKTPSPHADQEAYLTRLLDIVALEKVDLIVPVSEEALHVSLLEKRLPEGTRVFSHSNEMLQGLHDKYTFSQIAVAAGMTVPETHLASDALAGRLARARETVVKPRLGCSGQKMKMLSPRTVAAEDLSDPASVVQERIFGREVSTLSLCRNGEILAHVTYEGLVFAGTVAVCFQRVDEASSVEKWVSDFVRARNCSYFLAFDFIIDEDGAAWPLECNPRLTSGIHFLAPEDLARAILRFDENLPVGLKPERRFQEGHTTLLQVYGNILKPRTSLRHLRAMLKAKDVLWSMRDPMPFPLMTPYSWPVLKQVLLNGRTFGEAATRDIAWPPSTNAHSLETSQSTTPLNAHGS